MQVTVLGKSPAWQDAGGACSGYLVVQDEFTMLLDCGSGVFSKLRPVCDYIDVDVVLISHMHADHFLDLVPFSYALRYAPRQQPVAVAGWPGTSAPARPQLLLPVGGEDLLRRVVGNWGSADLINSAFAVTEYTAADALTVGPLHIRFCEVPHFVLSHAVEVSASGTRFTYGADCRPNQELVAFARGTDMLMVEATLPCPERDGKRGHLTPREAGEHGRSAAARRLVVTHYSDEMDPEWTRSEAAEGYGGPVELAREGAVYTV
ncbi:MAG TPA: MBL fold metallo-hydrolase [Solirubrobacteraceae bacterium]|nr:MBL fold metallo-hydrolase [Solirubrobacteraceae bacterium]